MKIMTLTRGVDTSGNQLNRWKVPVPVGFTLVGIRDLEDQVFFEGASHQLEGQRHAGA